MSRLSLDHLSGLFSIELVTPSIGPLGSGAGRAGSFVEHLEQARQMFENTADAYRTPLPPSRSVADDRKESGGGPPGTAETEDPSRQTSRNSAESGPSATAEAQSEPDQQGAVSESRSESDQQAGAVDPDQASDQDNGSDQDNENGEEESTTNPAQCAGALTVDALAEPGNQEDIDGDSVSPADADLPPEGQRRAVRPTQRNDPSAPRGETSPGEQEETDRSEAKTPPQESPAKPEANGRKVAHMREEKPAPDKTTPQPKGAAEDGDGPDEGAPSSANADRASASPPARESAAGARRHDGRQDGNNAPANHPSDKPAAQRPPGAEAASDRQDVGVDSQEGAARGAKGDMADTARGPSSPTGVNPTEAAGTTRPQLGQGPREPSTAPAPEASGSDQSDRVRFVQRVARAFEAASDHGGSIRLRLHPPDLGSLRLEVTVRNGTMTARLEVETNTARTMLLDNLPALRDRLAAQDIKVGRFDVNLTDGSPGGSPQGPAGHWPSHHHADQSPANTRPHQEVEMERPSTPKAVASPGQGSQLDVVI